MSIELFRIEHMRYEDFDTCDYFVKPEDKTYEEIEAIIKQAQENYVNRVMVNIPELPPYPQFDGADDETTIGQVRQKQQEWVEINALRRKLFDENPETFTAHLEKLGIYKFDPYSVHYDVKEIRLDWDPKLPASSTANY